MRVLREGDFIKTSTGKTSLNATLGNHQVMIDAIRDFYLDTGVAIGMKPAGGIRTAKQALQFLVAVKETLGDAWLTNEPLPLRGEHAAQRPPAPDREGKIGRPTRRPIISARRPSPTESMPTLVSDRKKSAARNGRPAPELIFGDLWEFDPAPETADPKLKSRYELFIGGEFVAPQTGQYFDSINPATEQKLAGNRPGRRGRRCRCRLRRRAPARLRRRDLGPRWPDATGPSTSSASPGSSRTGAREFAVAETMDGGKPIKESRDFDVPDVGGPFLLPRGLGGQAGVRRARRRGWRPWAWSARSSPGTFPSSCWPGSSRRPWPWGTAS